jgi:hypothetical protein
MKQAEQGGSDEDRIARREFAFDSEQSSRFS